MFDFKSLPEFSKLFPDEQACITFLDNEKDLLSLMSLQTQKVKPYFL